MLDRLAHPFRLVDKASQVRCSYLIAKILVGDGIHKHKVSARPTIADIAGNVVREVEVPVPADGYSGFTLGEPFRVAGNGSLVHSV